MKKNRETPTLQQWIMQSSVAVKEYIHQLKKELQAKNRVIKNLEKKIKLREDEAEQYGFQIQSLEETAEHWETASKTNEAAASIAQGTVKDLMAELEKYTNQCAKNPSVQDLVDTCTKGFDYLSRQQQNDVVVQLYWYLQQNRTDTIKAMVHQMDNMADEKRNIIEYKDMLTEALK